MIDNARSSLLDLTEAFRIAVEVHGAQRDKAGEPYMGHVCRVMSAMDTDEERAVAILHDVLEDSMPPKGSPDPMAWAKWDEMSDRIIEAYGWAIHTPVKLLTRMHDMTYMGYIRHVSENPLAVKVKLADLADNMDPARLAKLSEAERLRLLEKYGRARKYLVTTLRPTAAPVASAQHR